MIPCLPYTIKHFFYFVLVVTPDLSSIQDNAQLKVDLRKAQEACEKLSTQLTDSEQTREELEKKVSEHVEEVDVARKAKDRALHVNILCYIILCSSRQDNRKRETTSILVTLSFVFRTRRRWLANLKFSRRTSTSASLTCKSNLE